MANVVVEWRVFVPAAAHTPLASVLLGEMFQAWPVEAEDGVEDRTDRYLLLGSDGVGLKHRGKKGKLEVKVLTERWGPADCLGVEGGVEAWRKFKLKGKGKGHGKGGGGGGGSGEEEEGEGAAAGDDCIGPAQQEELERVLVEHRLLDARVRRALQRSDGGGSGPQEVAVAKSRLVGRLRLKDALADMDGAGDGDGGGGSSLAHRLLQRVMHSGNSAHPRPPPPTTTTTALPPGMDGDVELLLEDCVLELVEVGKQEGKHGKPSQSRWRSYQVEGPRAEVLHFLTATPLGRAMHAFAGHPGAVVAGYPAWLERVTTAQQGQEEEGELAVAAGDGTCAAMIARVTASPQFPIPPLPANPHRGVKENFKLKQVALVVVRHPTTGKYLAVEEQGDKGWWLPAGHVDPNETFAQAAYREALEEAGIGIKLEGILRVEHKLTAPTKGRLRVVYYGVPIHSDAPLKSAPDEESRGARWVTRAELLRLPLRSQELLQWIQYLEAGGAIYPLELFAGEHEPVPVPVPSAGARG